MSKLPLVALAALLFGGCATAGKLKTAQLEISAKDQKIAALEKENEGYIVLANTLRDEVTRLDHQNKELAKWYDEMLTAWGPELDRGNLEMVVYKDRTVFTLPETVYFETGSAVLSDDGQDAVAELALFLKQHPERRYQVEGHTDPRPIATAKYPDNWALGSARALAVVRELCIQGVPANQLSAATYADTSPVVASHSDTGLARNRRISVALVPTANESGAHAALFERARKSGRLVSAEPAGQDVSNVASLDGRVN